MTADLRSQEKLFDDFMDTAVTLFAKEAPSTTHGAIMKPEGISQPPFPATSPPQPTNSITCSAKVPPAFSCLTAARTS